MMIPDSVDFEACFWGAFLLLCDAENWEAHGALTPQECADIFLDAFFLSQDGFGDCQVTHYVGEIFLYAGATPPDGSLVCDGAWLSETTYPDLFAAIGSAFGTDGGGNFRIPDLRGRVPIGIGQTGFGSLYEMGDKAGTETVQLDIEEMPEHNHTVKRQATLGGGIVALTNAISATVTEFGTSYSGQGLAHPNMQPYLAINFLIQAE